MNESMKAKKEDLRRQLTEEDLLLGKKANKFFDVLCVIALAACAGIIVFVFTNVPWNTRMPYEGKHNYSGTGIPMQIALLPCVLVLLGLWRSGRKPDAHEMTKAGRIGVYTFGTAMIAGCAWGQWIMGEAILTAGGFFAR